MFGGPVSPPGARTFGGLDRSNAQKSLDAGNASKAAKEASGRASSSDADTHRAAARAHDEAADRQEEAGNASKAKQHRGQAQVHREKAEENSRAEWFADDQARAAHNLTQKAEKSKYGQDPTDPRTPQQLHQDAARAHDKAAAAYQLANKPVEAQYHADKAVAHADVAQPKAQ